MDLLLFRHAAARPADADATADARPLSPRGRRRFRRVVDLLDARGLRIERVVHSPARCAMETAELLRPLLDGETEVSAELQGPPTDALLARLTGGSIAVVGHAPWLGELLGRLTGAPAGLVDWRKGGLVWLTGAPEAGPMQIRAVVSPRWAKGAS